MNATTIQNVVTYNTTIAFDNPDLRLFPGMTAYVSIPVARANNVVKIPNGALRFKPDLTDSERKTLYAKYSINENAVERLLARIAAGTSCWRCRAGASEPGRCGSRYQRQGARPRGATGGGQGGQGGAGNRRGQGGGQNGGTWGGRKQPTRGHRHRLEAASGQDARACPSGARRDRLYVYGDD